jgi:hypothetical protein
MSLAGAIIGGSCGKSRRQFNWINISMGLAGVRQSAAAELWQRSAAIGPGLSLGLAGVRHMLLSAAALAEVGGNWVRIVTGRDRRQLWQKSAAGVGSNRLATVQSQSGSLDAQGPAAGVAKTGGNRVQLSAAAIGGSLSLSLGPSAAIGVKLPRKNITKMADMGRGKTPDLPTHIAEKFGKTITKMSPWLQISVVKTFFLQPVSLPKMAPQMLPKCQNRFVILAFFEGRKCVTLM